MRLPPSARRHRVFSALLACALLNGTPGFAAHKEEPGKTYSFEFTPAAPGQAVAKFLSTIKSAGSGPESLRAQYLAADMLLGAGQAQAAADILQSLAAASTNDEFFKFSVLQKFGDACLQLGQYKQAFQAYDKVRQGPMKALVPEAVLGQAISSLALGDREKAYVHLRELFADYPAYEKQTAVMFPAGLIQ